jgi:hypothetical protein
MTENNSNYIGLTCKECGQPIDIKTAIHTPTGYICKNCRNQRSKNFSTSKGIDFLVGSVIAFVFSALTSLLIGFISSALSFYSYFIIIFVTPFVGKLIANIVRATTGKRRSNALFLVTTVATALGAFLPVSGIIFLIITGGMDSLGILMIAIAPLVYAIMLTGSYYFYISGRRIKF